MVHGSQTVLQGLLYRTVGQKMGLRQPEGNLSNVKKKGCANQRGEKRGLGKYDNPHKESKDKGKKGKKSKTSDTEKKKEDITLTQIAKQYEFIGHSDSEEAGSEKEEDEERILSRKRFLSPLTLVQSLKVGASNPANLLVYLNFNLCGLI